MREEVLQHDGPCIGSGAGSAATSLDGSGLTPDLHDPTEFSVAVEVR